jgi:SagB-type dehydrogenase family enzyme
MMVDAIRAGRAFLRSNWEKLDSMESDQAKGVPAPLQEDPAPNGATIVALGSAEALDLGKESFSTLLRKRRSRRKYSADSVRIEELSFLCFACEGVKEAKPLSSFRTVPSGGARHPLDLYVYVERVSGIDPGLYRYLPLEHALVLHRGGDDKEALDRALLGQFWNAAAVFIWVAVPYRTEWRYSVAAHKLVVLDAGHACQNLYLACESIGCGTCAIGAYDQALLDAFLDLDGEDRIALYAAPVGRITV